MGKLIDTDELMEWVSSWFEWNCRWYPYSKSNDIPITELKYFLDQMDGVEAETVKHGRWIDVPVPWGFKCSACNEWFVIGQDYKRYNYCPYCGADMRQMVEDDKSHPFADDDVMMGEKQNENG